MRRREFISLLASGVAWPVAARAQQQRKIWRIGFVSGITQPAEIKASPFGGFLEGMHQLGYVEGRHFTVEWRFADGKYQRFQEFADELVKLDVDVIVVAASAAIRTIQRSTDKIPIVMGYSIDPVGHGLVASLARPGGNTTGLASAQEEIVAKHVELLTVMSPGLGKLAIVINPDNPNHQDSLRKAEAAVFKAGLQFVTIRARTPHEVEAEISTAATSGARAAVFVPDSFFNAHRHRIAELAIKHHLPTIFAQRDYATAGGLMSYGESFWEFFRRAAVYVDKLFKGTKPGELPVEQPTKFDLVINLKTARALGLSVPPLLLARADEVIE